MDNHQSHLSYEALSLAKENFIHIITLPPHTSNKTQPLDRTVFGSMKTHYNQLADSWMMRNVGKLLTTYQIAELAGTALTKATTPDNVIAGFRVSGVWLFDKDFVSNVDYLPSDITDRSAPEDNHAVDIAPTVGPSRSLSTSGQDNHAVDIAPTVAQPRSLSTSGENNHAVDIAPTVVRPVRCQPLEKTIMRLEKTTMRLTLLQQLPSPVHGRPLGDRLVLR